MKLQNLTWTFMLRTAGLDPKKVNEPQGSLKWKPVFVLPASGLPDKSVLAKSILSNVDAPPKKRHFLVMVQALYEAVRCEDFSGFFNDSLVEFKEAHSFFRANKREIVRELKQGRKDRIYLYPHNCDQGRFIFVFSVLHKNQTTTPAEIKDYTESVVKQIHATRHFTVIEEKNSHD